MIVFKKVSIRNFLSVGDNPLVFHLNRAHTTLITGNNGAGKTTLISAIIFALYNRTQKNINIPQIVNTINKKQCVVELEFMIGSTEYRIVRGLKPKIFEIYKAGKLVNQESHTKDYQKYLETHILKMNYKVFSQIVSLSSNNFIPFMKLSAADRRNIIEDLLDIQVFSRMNELLKLKLGSLKESIDKLKTEEKLLENTLQLHKEYLRKKKDDVKQSVGKLQEERKEILVHIEDVKKLISYNKDILNAFRAELDNYSGVEDQVAPSSFKVIDIKTRIESLEEKADFFIKTEVCHACQQNIAHEHKASMANHIQSQIEELQKALLTAQEEETAIKKKFDLLTDLKIRIKNQESEVKALETKLESENRYLDRIDSNIASLKLKQAQETGDDLKKIEDFKNQHLTIKKRKEEYHHQLSIYSMAIVVLKDSGIKTKIISQYIPIINQLINKFLRDMDFHIQFEIDETFNEKIRTRYRETFSYDSFSEGEKARIDLALLFTWREIAKMRNSASCNLLLLDETFDSSLDSTADESLISLIQGLKNTNVFVISHKGSHLYDKFHSHIKIEKMKNFTKIVA